MPRRRRAIDRAFVLLVAMLAAQALVQLRHAARPLVADEIYWVAKARFIATHGRIPRVDPGALAVERGETWGNSDWRPQGYPLFLAAISGGDFEDPASELRLRSTAVQTLLLSALLILLYRIGVEAGLEGVRRYAAACVLGACPWPFEFIVELGADTLNAVVMTTSILMLWRSLTTGRRPGLIAAAALLASTTLLIRPEMIVMAPLVVALALLISRDRRPVHWLIAGGSIASVLLIQVAYRTYATGAPGIYGGLHIPNRGAFDWTATWLGTEKEGYDFVYSLGSDRQPPLPDRAFGSDAEKREVNSILKDIAGRGAFTEEDDAAFAALARQRRQDRPVFVTALRLWHAAHLWLNIENPTPWLIELSALSRTARRPILGSLVLLRLGIFALAFLATARAFHRWRMREDDAWDRLTLLCAALILGRTVLIGLVLNWKVHRYALVAWPAMLWCATAGLRSLGRGVRPLDAVTPVPGSPAPTA